MLKTLRDTIRETAIYGLGSVATKATGFILFPLYSFFFSVAEYGVIVRVEVFWQYLWALINFGTTVALFKGLSESPSPEEQRKVLSSVFLFYLCIAALLALVTFPFRSEISRALLGSPEYSSIVSYSFFVALAEALLFLPLVVARNEHRPWSYVVLTIINASVVTAGQLFILFNAVNKLEGIYIMRCLGPLVALAIGYWMIRNRISLRRIHFGRLAGIIRFSYPIMLAGVLSISLNNLDRYLLGGLAGSHEVGLYGLGYNVAGLLNLLLISPFLLVFNASVWQRIHHDPKAAEWLTRVMTYALFAFTFAALALSLFISDFIRVFAMREEYWNAETVVPILALSYVLYGTANIGLVSFYAVQKTLNVLWLYLTVTAINVLLNILLIPIVGMYGAAGASVLSFLVHNILIFRFSRRYYFFPYEFRRGVLLFAVAGALFTVGHLIHIDGVLPSIAFRFLVLLGFPLLLVPLRFYEFSELQRIRELGRQYLPFKFFSH